MSRQARVVEGGVAFHITARGNYRQDVFPGPDDRQAYLNLLARHSSNEGLRILGWCLMTNHVHLLGVPERRESLAGAMKRTQGDYARLINRRHHRHAGHLWQSRFYSCPLGGDAVWTALRYIECNPVRAGVVAAAEACSWSSAAVHCGLAEAPQFLALDWWREAWTAERWRSVLELGPDERQVEALRQATHHGVPLGERSFLERMAQQAGRDLVMRPVGRPRLGAGGVDLLWTESTAGGMR